MDKLDIKVKRTQEEKTPTDADAHPELLESFVMPKPIRSEAVAQTEQKLVKAAKLSKQDMGSMTDEELLAFLDGKGANQDEIIYPGTQFSVQSELTRRAIQKASKPGIYTKVSLALAALSLAISVASSWSDLKDYLSLLAGSKPSAQVSAPVQPNGNAGDKMQNEKPKEE